MLKKNLKLKSRLIRNLKPFIIFLLFFHSSCSSTLDQHDAKPVSLKKDSVIKYDTTCESLFKCTTKGPDGQDRITDHKFKKRSFSSDLLENVKLSNVILDSCTFPVSFNLMRCDLVNVCFINCTFLSGIKITNSKEIDNLIFDKCRISSLVILQSGINQLLVKSFEDTDTIPKITIQDCPEASSVIFSGNIRKIFLEGGQIKNLDITKINNADCEITVTSTSLINPNLYSDVTTQPDVFLNASLQNANFIKGDESILLEELAINSLNTPESYSTSRSSITKKLVAIRTAYNHLSRIFSDQKKFELSDYFYYRSKICDSQITYGQFGQFWNYFWHQKVRGNYGTNAAVVSLSMLYVFLFFTLIYFIAGFFHCSFGFLKYTSLSGDEVSHFKPKLIALQNNHKNIIEFTIHCLLFSLNQMVLGGLSSGFYLRNFTILHLSPPRKYGLMGTGFIRFLALIQNVLSLALMFFFITAFLKLNR